MKYLVDTNSISELYKKSPDSRVIQWFLSIGFSQLYLSCITIGEIKKGILKLAKKDKIASLKLEKWLEGIIVNYNERILNIDKETCEEWGELMSIDSMHGIDTLIAAQAKQKNMILVTRNTKHYDMFNIKIFNPFIDL